MPRSLALVFSLVALAAALPARADTSAGGEMTTGYGYRGLTLRGSLDLDQKKSWEADLGYAYAHSKTGTESRSNQVSASLYHDFDPNWTGRLGLTHWRDTLNGIAYTGPTGGAAYAAYEAGAAEHDPAAELYKVSVDADLFVYKADATTAPRVVRRRTGPVLVPGQPTSVGLTQLHPYVTLEKPVLAASLMPWVSAGYYLYSKDPGVLEQRAGDPRFAASATSINGLVGGLLRSSGTLGLDARLPGRIRLGVSLGAQKVATDGTWATTQGASAKAGLQEHLDVSAAWSRTIQYGAALDLVSGGASWTF